MNLRRDEQRKRFRECHLSVAAPIQSPVRAPPAVRRRAREIHGSAGREYSGRAFAQAKAAVPDPAVHPQLERPNSSLFAQFAFVCNPFRVPISHPGDSSTLLHPCSLVGPDPSIRLRSHGNPDSRKLIAEALGTFFLVFVAVGGGSGYRGDQDPRKPR